MTAFREPRWLGVVLAAILLGALGTFAWRNLPYTGFWYDETMQFWMSRGTDGFRPPGSHGDGRLVSVVRQNGRANLDPGGFSLMLALWLRGGTDPVWLRALPFGLFLAGLGVMARLGWLWGRTATFAVLGAAIPLGFPLLLYHATEVRAYTMEFLGVAVGCLLLHRLEAGVSVRAVAALGVALAVFMSSRYSYAIFAGAAALVAAPTICSKGGPSRRVRIWRLLALGGPLAAGALFVALNLWLQRGRLTYHGGALIEYLTPATAAGKSAPALLRVLASNLLSPVAVPVTVAAVVALVPAAWRARRPGVLRRLAAPESRTLYGLAAAVLVLSAILWPWHPWDVSQKWSLFLHALSAVMILRLLSDIAVWRWDLAETGGLRAWERAAWTVVPALLIVGLSAHAATQRRLHWNDVTAALRHLETVPLGPGSVSVAGHPYPTLRYLAEFGPFTGRLPYPAAFRPPHGDRAAIGPETRYIISYERPGTLARGYPGYTFEAEPSWPAHLYRVGTAPGR